HCVRTLTSGSVERPRSGQSVVEPAEILLPAHDHRTERLQVVGQPLHVDETATALVHHHDEMDQGDFGRIPGAVEHGLSGEETADGDAVESAHQLLFLVVPHLDGVGPAETVELGVGLDDLVGDPPVLTSRVGATPDHAIEVPVHRHLVTTGGLPHRSTHPGTVHGQDRPLYRRPPGEAPVLEVHWYTAPPVVVEELPLHEPAT